MKIRSFSKADFLSFSACLSTLIGLSSGMRYSNKYSALLCIALSFFVIIFSKTIIMSPYDLFVIFSCLYTLVNRYSIYYVTPAILLLMANLCIFAYRQPQSIKTSLRVVCVYSIVNLFVNLLSVLEPKLYYVLLKKIMNGTAYENARREIMYGTIVGMTDHYSRNAFYCVAGGSVFFSLALAHREKRVIYYLLAFIELGMIMIIGKRAHFFFIIASIIITYILASENLKKSFSNFLKISVALVLVLAFTIEYIPAASNVLERTARFSSGDMSNGRFRLWKIAFDAFEESPIFGKGFGFFNSTIRVGLINQTWAGVHNDYIQWLCELGIIGFIMNIIPMIGVYILSIRELKCIVRNTEDKDNYNKLLIIWSVIFQTFIILYSMTGLPHFDVEVNILYCFSMAVPIALINLPECNAIHMTRYIVKW